MNDTPQQAITADLETVSKLKDRLNSIVQSNKKLPTELRLGIMRYCLMQDSFPERLPNDTDDTYRVKLVETRRRLLSELTLEKCLLIALGIHQ